MKKLTAILLSLIMCFALAGTAFASDAPTQEDFSAEASQQEGIGDIIGSFLPENNDPELEKVIAILSTVATYIYDYATQPEEPAVDLQTVLTILTVVVTVIYTLAQNI